MNRIFFKGNPYPNGHKIEEFTWNARLQKDKGLIFDFHLKTENYYAEDFSELDNEEKEISDWNSKIVWGNYHNCTMSSTYWSGNGIIVGTKENKLYFNKLIGKTLTADPLPQANETDNEDLAFNIYLLGHDDCANHKITFYKKFDKSTFAIDWSGNIALSYAGDYEYKYFFKATIEKVKFEGISFDRELTRLENEKLLKMYLADFVDFEVIDNKFKIKI